MRPTNREADKDVPIPRVGGGCTLGYVTVASAGDAGSRAEMRRVRR